MGFARGVLVVGALLVVLPPLPAFSQALSVASLVENPGRYDGKVVTVSGVITAYRERVSRAGNPYTTFRLQEGGASVGVFAWGHRGLREGARVRVTGVFQRVRRVGRFTFYNEIEVRRIDILDRKTSPDGVERAARVVGGWRPSGHMLDGNGTTARVLQLLGSTRGDGGHAHRSCGGHVAAARREA